MKNTCLSQAIEEIPSPEIELMQGVKWGRCDQLFTPAYWKIQYKLHEDCFNVPNYRIGENLLHEISACILGGFGIKAEMAMTAFERLRDEGLLELGVEYDKVYNTLSAPFYLNTRKVHYRFPKQKAKYLFDFFQRNDLSTIPIQNDIALRTWLLSVKGIGLKTASWITRNWLHSSNVAILDIHIQRAGLIAGFFQGDFSIAKDYLILEKQYLDFCSALNVNPANLDALIWLQLKMANNIAIDLVNNNNN